MVVLVLLRCQLQGCLKGIARCPQQFTGEGGGFFATYFIAGNGVVVLTAVLVKASANVEVQRVLDNRAADIGIGVGGVMLGNGDGDLTLHFVGRAAGHVVDCAGEGGATVECRLRAFDDLDTLEHL